MTLISWCFDTTYTSSYLKGNYDHFFISLLLVVLDRYWPVDTVKKSFSVIGQAFPDLWAAKNTHYTHAHYQGGAYWWRQWLSMCGCLNCVGLVIWIQCQPQAVQIAATQVTQKAQAVVVLQILQCLALIGLNQVNLTLKLQELVQMMITSSMRDSHIYHGMCS